MNPADCDTVDALLPACVEQSIRAFNTEGCLWTELLVRPRGVAPGPELERWILARELSGQLAELDLAMLRLALSLAMQRGPQARISINIGPGMLREGPARFALLMSLLRAGPLAACICLEIGAFRCEPRERRSLVELLGTLRALGVSIALDDYGGGGDHADLLKSGCIDWVKLDRRLLQDPAARSRLDRLVGTAQAASVKVVAEGIERSKQLAWALEHCHAGQGFLLGDLHPVGTPVPIRPVRHA